MGNENNCVSKLVWGLDQTIEFEDAHGNQLLCDLIYLSSMDPHNYSLPQITHCLRPIQKKDMMAISQMWYESYTKLDF